MYVAVILVVFFFASERREGLTIVKTITVKIDTKLARKYRQTYLKTFKSEKALKRTEKEFLRAFVEDRLREEIDFLRREPT
jgi:hypothetical protein